MHRLVLTLWERHRPGVLLVTHDVDEALALADRVLVLSGGQITHACRVTEPRPGHRDQPELVTLRTQLLTRAGGTDTEGTDMTKVYVRRPAPDLAGRDGCWRPGCVIRRRARRRSSGEHAPAQGSSVSNVTLNIGDQKGTGARGAADRRRPDQQAAVQGRLVGLHLRPADAAGHGLGRDRHRRRRRRPAGLRRGRRLQGRDRRRPDGEPAGRRAAGAEELADPPRSPQLTRQEDRDRAGQLRQLSPARGAHQGGADRSRTSRWTTCSPPTRWPRSRSGQVDAWDVWSPYIEQAVAQDHARILVNGVRLSAAPTRSRWPPRPPLANPAKAAAIKVYLQLLDQAYVWAAHAPAGLGHVLGARRPGCRAAS